MNSQDTQFENFINPPQNSGQIADNPSVIIRDEKGRFAPGCPKPETSGVKKGYKGWKPILEELADEEVEVRNLGKVPAMYAAGKAMFNKAINGDVYAFSVISDRMDGRPGQNMNHKLEGTIIYEQVNLSDIKK